MRGVHVLPYVVSGFSRTYEGSAFSRTVNRGVNRTCGGSGASPAYVAYVVSGFSRTHVGSGVSPAYGAYVVSGFSRTVDPCE
jgi:hypothetical protein